MFTLYPKLLVTVRFFTLKQIPTNKPWHNSLRIVIRNCNKLWFHLKFCWKLKVLIKTQVITVLKKKHIKWDCSHFYFYFFFALVFGCRMKQSMRLCLCIKQLCISVYSLIRVAESWIEKKNIIPIFKSVDLFFFLFSVVNNHM